MINEGMYTPIETNQPKITYIDATEREVAQITSHLIEAGFHFNLACHSDAAVISAFGETALYIARSLPNVHLDISEDEFGNKPYVRVSFDFMQKGGN